MRIKALVLAFLALIWLLPTLGCMDEYPYYSPQSPNTGGATESRAYNSGEANKTALASANQEFDVVEAADTESTVEPAEDAGQSTTEEDTNN